MLLFPVSKPKQVANIELLNVLGCVNSAPPMRDSLNFGQSFLTISASSPEAMLNMNETPQPNATMMTQKVMRKRKTSCSMLLIDRMMGPKYFVAMPICSRIYRVTMVVNDYIL